MGRVETLALDDLAIPELQELRDRIDRTLQRKREETKRALRERLEQLAEREGFTLPELIATSAKRSRKKAKAKYANPKNPSQTWAGRGKQPAWVKQALADGKALADLAV